jgi:hypothetical protein
MKLSKTLATLLMAGSLPLMAGPVAAAPVSQPLALKNVDMSIVDDVQFRRGRRGGLWIGPAAGFAAGVVIGNALAPRYDDGYYAYGAAPDYVPGRRAGYRYCHGDAQSISGYPSWACDNRRETEW